MYFDRNIDLSEKISMAKKVQAIIRRTATYFRGKITLDSLSKFVPFLNPQITGGGDLSATS